MNTCQGCGMPVEHPAEYHPFAACLMFEVCQNSEIVRANLTAVIEYGMLAERNRLSAEQAFRDTRLTRKSAHSERKVQR